MDEKKDGGEPLRGNRLFAFVLTFLPIFGPWALLQDHTLGPWHIFLLAPFVIACNACAAFNLITEHGKKSLWWLVVSLLLQVLLWWMYARTLIS